MFVQDLLLLGGSEADVSYLSFGAASPVSLLVSGCF